MFLAVPNRPAFLSSPKKLFSVIAILCLALIAQTTASLLTHSSAEGLRFELPANGNLRIENLRGGVIVEVWNQDYVSVSAVADNGQISEMPAVIDRTDSLLSIRVTRGPKVTSRINLELRIPIRTHAAVITNNGSVEVKGTPAALLVQTVSGEIRAELSKDVGVDLTADSKTGEVFSSLASIQPAKGARPQLQARLDKGGRTIKLISQAGNINVAAAGAPSDSSPGIAAITPAMPVEKRQPLGPAELPTPTQRPELTGQNNNATPAGTPAKPSNGPEEIAEGDIIRVDTELVSVNVSVVDRGTNRGVNDLTKDDFRLYEDNAQQQIAHFDSASSPFNLILLIDLSGSSTKVVELIKAAAVHFVEAARPFDRIAVITFAGGQAVVSSLTTDHQVLRQRINSIEKPQGSTKLYDSLAFAMDEVFREAKDSRRNAIVLMSDGLDSVLPNVTGEGSQTSYEEVVRRAKEFDGVVYSIWTDTQSYEPLSPLDIQQETFDLAHDRMKEIADAGGGAFYECEEIKDLAGAYERVVADLGMVYTLSYRPTNKVRDGSWRAIRVNVSRQNAVARGKRGYFAK
jgi:VWFA-related protein